MICKLTLLFHLPPIRGSTIFQDEIFGSAYASAVYISQILKFPKDKKVYVIGEKGLEDELRSEGISCCGGSVRIERLYSNRSLVDENGVRLLTFRRLFFFFSFCRLIVPAG